MSYMCNAMKIPHVHSFLENPSYIYAQEVIAWKWKPIAWIHSGLSQPGGLATY